MQSIVIVGGGAGGLELATRLGRAKLNVTLIDRERTHLWKPLLHEVATGTLDDGVDALSYRAHCARVGIRFHLGQVNGMDRERRELLLAPMLGTHGEEVLHARRVAYDTLVWAVGAHSNDFGISGVREHCHSLDSSTQAQAFHLELLNRFLHLQEEGGEHERVTVAIVGAGATGVELAAELFNAAEMLAHYGVERAGRKGLRVLLIEAAGRVLPALPEVMSQRAQSVLENLGVELYLNTAVQKVESNSVLTKDAELLAADLIVWAAGIQAPSFLARLGLPVNRINQLEVEADLRVKGEEGIYALGDCACLREAPSSAAPAGRLVPPRAQAAHQMAKFLAQVLIERARHPSPARTIKPFAYHDHGSLVSLADYQTLGSVMDDVMHGRFLIEGPMARAAYLSLYRQHQLTLHGSWRTALMILASGMNQWIRPSIKLY
ncbi:MAG: NAD(P)/FAD-dependent oxidoreductase [Halothiobacillaceae bacterium]|nr:NAD(P)/FAD-dependent oxidoreductase [Halothiobacillaceae bacterium]